MARLNTIAKYAQPEVVEFWREFSKQGLQRCEDEMLARYAPTPPARVLDLGCGAGRAGLALTPRGYTVTGLDLAREMLEAARELVMEEEQTPRLAQADLRAIPCANASFDLALIFIAAIQHIPTREARRKGFAEVARVLCPGGVLILALDNLAPALTCYAWWGWRKMVGGRVTGKMRRAQAADALLESRRRGASAWTWHARGIARTLRWRTWNGALDAMRAAHGAHDEIGDTAIEQVSLTPTPGAVYYHIYRHSELVEDAGTAGLKLLGYHSGSELSDDTSFAPRVRQLDKQVLYAFQRGTEQIRPGERRQG